MDSRGADMTDRLDEYETSKVIGDRSEVLQDLDDSRRQAAEIGKKLGAFAAAVMHDLARKVLEGEPQE